MPPTVLLTGASGLAGSALRPALVRSGAAVRALVHRTPVRDVESVGGDLRDPATLAAALRGVEAVVHAAARFGGGPGELAAVNVDGTRALAQAACGAGVERFVLLGSATVYAPGPMTDADEHHPLAPPDDYATSKLEAERAAREVLGDDRVTVLRLPSLYRAAPSPFTSHLALAIRDVELPWIDGVDPQVELLHVDDLAATVVAALTGAPGTYNVGAVDRPTYRELVTAAASALPFEPRWAPCASEADAARFAPPVLAAASVPRTLSSRAAREALGHAPARDWRTEIPAAMAAIVAAAS